MKKFILAAAAVATLGAGASAAQAKVNVDLYFGGFGGGYYGHGHHNHYEPVGYYTTKCHFKNVKVVKWVYGEKVVIWKKKKICKPVYIGY